MGNQVISISLGILLTLLPVSVRAEVNEIAVTGSAVAYVKATYATIGVQISSLSKKATEATQNAAELHQRIVSALREIPVSDVHTEQYRVAPRWSRDEHGQRDKFLGYEANHNVVVTLRDIEVIGTVVDAVVEAGAKNVGAVKYHAEVTDSLQLRALGEAVRQARERAEAIAAAAGGHLGELIELATGDAARAMRREIPSGAAYSRLVVGTTIMPSATRVHVVVLGRWRFVEDTSQ